MEHEIFLNILDFIIALDLEIDVLEYNINHYDLDVPNCIKKYLLTEIELDKNNLSRKKALRKKVVRYLKNKFLSFDLPFWVKSKNK